MHALPHSAESTRLDFATHLRLRKVVGASRIGCHACTLPCPVCCNFGLLPGLVGDATDEQLQPTEGRSSPSGSQFCKSPPVSTSMVLPPHGAPFRRQCDSATYSSAAESGRSVQPSDTSYLPELRKGIAPLFFGALAEGVGKPLRGTPEGLLRIAALLAACPAGGQTKEPLEGFTDVSQVATHLIISACWQVQLKPRVVCPSLLCRRRHSALLFQRPVLCRAPSRVRWYRISSLPVSEAVQGRCGTRAEHRGGLQSRWPPARAPRRHSYCCRGDLALGSPARAPGSCASASCLPAAPWSAAGMVPMALR